MLALLVFDGGHHPRGECWVKQLPPTFHTHCPVPSLPACMFQGLWVLIWKAQILDLIVAFPSVMITIDLVAGGFPYLSSFLYVVCACVCMQVQGAQGRHSCLWRPEVSIWSPRSFPHLIH